MQYFTWFDAIREGMQVLWLSLLGNARRRRVGSRLNRRCKRGVAFQTLRSIKGRAVIRRKFNAFDDSSGEVRLQKWLVQTEFPE